MFVFRKIWRALFFWNTRFEIRPFALLPAIYQLITWISKDVSETPSSFFRWQSFGIIAGSKHRDDQPSSLASYADGLEEPNIIEIDSDQ